MRNLAACCCANVGPFVHTRKLCKIRVFQLKLISPRAKKTRFIFHLVFENPALPRVIIVTPTVYPRFVLNYDFSYFPYKTPLSLTLESKNQIGSPKFHNQNLKQIGQGVHELCTDTQTSKQTNREYNFIYIEDVIQEIRKGSV